CGGKLDGVVAGASVANSGDIPGELLTSTNYFGGITTLDGLRPMLARGDAPKAVGIGSSSMNVVPIVEQLLELYLAGDEAAARDLSARFGREDPAVHVTSQFGFVRWIREQATKPEWIGEGINLNAIAPGAIVAPTRTADEITAVKVRGNVYPVPAGRPGTTGEIADLVGFLLSESAGYLCGTIIFIDGGTEAAVRSGNSPAPIAVL
ncbi:MAG: SDR family oxidoreductase, partial [Ilumatobacteraceae bacterium]